MAATALAAAGSAMEVPAGPLRMVPYAEPLILGGRVEVHPTASFGNGYDSNLDGNGTGDAFAHGTLGGHAHWYATPDFDSDLDLQLGRVMYLRTSERNTTDLVADLGSTYAGPSWDLAGGGAANHGRETLSATGEQLLRNRFSGRFGGERRDAGPYVKVGATAGRLDYLEDSRLFSRQQASRTTLGGGLRVGWRAVNDARYYLFERGDWSHYDSQRRFRDGVIADVGAGLGFALTPSVSFDLDAGIAVGRYTAPAFNDPAYRDQRVQAPYVEFGMRWEWEADSSFTLRVDSGLADGVTSNAVTRFGSTLLGDFRLREHLQAFGEAGAHHETDSGAPAGSSPDVRDIGSLTIGIRGTPRPGLGLQLATGWFTTIDRAGDGYSRLTIEGTLGVAF